MNYLRLYKDFYCIESNPVSGDIYNSINTYETNAKVYIENDNNIIESPIVINESLGRYYVELNLDFYNIDDIYEIYWNVKYTENSPFKLLKTRFKFKPIVIGQNIDIRLNNEEIRLEIVNK